MRSSISYRVKELRFIAIKRMLLQVEESEYSIIKNNKVIESETHAVIDYKDKVCIKPWGHEFLVFENTKVAIWYLMMKRGHSTSLHCHFKKDTILLVLSGCAKIGLVNNKKVILNTMECLFIPKYKFHSISSFSDETYIIEIEVFSKGLTFSDKNDLLRLDDQYMRKPVGYESSVNVVTNNLEQFNSFYLNENTSCKVNKATLSLHRIEKNNDLLKLEKNAFSILLEGEVFEAFKYYKEGSILSSTKEARLASSSCLVLTIDKLDAREDSKLVYTKEQLQLLKTNLDSEGKSIILTSGCYDILHVGHLETLRQAKSFGDVLIVCLSSDEQIKILKGDTRPINNYNDRINLFKTISYVDYIVLYNEEDIENEGTLGSIMKTLDPLYWVKGSDYTIEKILSKHPYLKNIKIVPLVEEKSTTRIIHKIQTT
jgi:rfaE bifunctional protein nucleotidyltransferase chain/domain